MPSHETSVRAEQGKLAELAADALVCELTISTDFELTIQNHIREVVDAAYAAGMDRMREPLEEAKKHFEVLAKSEELNFATRKWLQSCADEVGGVLADALPCGPGQSAPGAEGESK